VALSHLLTLEFNLRLRNVKISENGICVFTREPGAQPNVTLKSRKQEAGNTKFRIYLRSTLGNVRVRKKPMLRCDLCSHTCCPRAPDLPIILRAI
jgi:hypothetical protein